MFFVDYFYWIFTAIAVLIFYFVPVKVRPLILFGTGIFYYTYYAGLFVLMLVAEVIIVYFMVRQIRARSSKAWFTFGLLLVIGLLGFFKYHGMVVDTINQILSIWEKPQLPRIADLILPLAISYFTFELIHYITEMRRDTLPKHHLQHFLAFILYFPTLVAGPIKQFQNFMPQLANRFSWQNIYIGITRILIGLFKKLVLANTLTIYVQPLNTHDSIALADPLVLWIGLVAYTFVIYFDFSGYSDIAIGTSRLFGIVLPENFRWPYLSRNIGQFWRSWHISLSQWLTKYVYFPLGGSRVAKPRIYLNLLITLGVSGLWHGAAWHFVVWGLFHGVMLCIHRFYAKEIKPHLRVPSVFRVVTVPLAIGITFFGVVVSRVFFILPLQEAWFLLTRLFAGIIR